MFLHAVNYGPVPVLICPPQMPHDQTRNHTQVAAVGNPKINYLSYDTDLKELVYLHDNKKLTCFRLVNFHTILSVYQWLRRRFELVIGFINNLQA
jgi:hypothetical protein